jgi:hypothetical protein
MSEDAAREADARLDVIFGRRCSCPERHAVTGRCPQRAELATRAGGMCIPCAYCFTGYDWLGGQPLLEASMPVNRLRLD